MSERLDFLAIGDITTDAFITIKDVRIDTEPDQGDAGLNEICFRFGDKIEYEKVDIVSAVGNSPNAAVSATRLGLATGLYAEMGNDRNGEDCLNVLKEEGVNTEYIRVNNDKKTNYHYVLRYGAERTILVKHEEYDYSLPSFKEAPKWLYLSSLGVKSVDLHHEIASYVKESGAKLAFQPGTFQMKLGRVALKDIYESTEIFFCNKEEAERILDVEPTDLKTLLSELRSLGPNIIVITDGPNGAYAHNGSETYFVPRFPDSAPPVDRTGAGDAFGSTFTSALALGLDIPTALLWAPINAMNVVQHIGAQKGLLSQEEIKKFLENAPKEYGIQTL